MKNKLLKVSIAYTFCNILIKGMSFISIPLFSRILSTDEYGVFSTYMAYEGILFVIIGLALHGSLKSANIEFRLNFERYCSSILLLPIINMIIFMIVGLIIYPLISGFLGFSKIILILLFVHSFSSAIIAFYNEKISLHYGYKSFLKIAISISILDLILSLLFVLIFFTDSKLLGRVLGSVIPVSLISILLLLNFFKKNKPKYNYEYWKFGVSYSIPLVFHGISRNLLAQFDRIMIQNLVSASATAIYSLSCNIGMIITIIGNSISTTWGPFFFKEVEKRNYKIIRDKSTMYIEMVTSICVCALLITPDILTFIAPETYWEGKYCIPPIVLGTFFTFLYNFPAEVEYYYKKTKFIAFSTIAAAIFNVITNYIFIRKFGYISAAYTTLVSYIIYFILHLIISIKISNRVFFDLKKISMQIIKLIMFTILTFLFIDIFIIRLLLLICYLMLFLNKRGFTYRRLMNSRRIKYNENRQ